ncbi:alpha/beta fold hydrolase [Nonomuraea sp. NPDC050556]|uniref:alpha/beta fold hydrolase n=1 Tax=Nonomuraea sp. NPDC050556 TaxID=3364369 RepID=UPI0037897BEC
MIHYEMRGNGPLLLISESGEGDAGRSIDMATVLAETHTVVTYDRRGLSRSVSSGGVGIAEHAEDVRELLDHLGRGPAVMVGCSMGAVIGLHVAASHPGLVSTLVAHEPVAPWLLDSGDAHREQLGSLRELYREAGLAGAIRPIAASLGIVPGGDDAETGLTPQPMTPQREANFAYFIEHDFTAVQQDELDVSLLKASGTRIVPAVGRTTPKDVYVYRETLALAEVLGAPVVEFPGGHNGNLTHPRAFAAQILATLTA